MAIRGLNTVMPEDYSRANLMFMRAFAEAWPDFASHSIVQQAVGQIQTRTKERDITQALLS